MRGWQDMRVRSFALVILLLGEVAISVIVKLLRTIILISE